MRRCSSSATAVARCFLRHESESRSFYLPTWHISARVVRHFSGRIVFSMTARLRAILSSQSDIGHITEVDLSSGVCSAGFAIYR